MEKIYTIKLNEDELDNTMSALNGYSTYIHREYVTPALATEEGASWAENWERRMDKIWLKFLRTRENNEPTDRTEKALRILVAKIDETFAKDDIDNTDKGKLKELVIDIYDRLQEIITNY